MRYHHYLVSVQCRMYLGAFQSMLTYSTVSLREFLAKSCCKSLPLLVKQGFWSFFNERAASTTYQAEFVASQIHGHVEGLWPIWPLTLENLRAVVASFKLSFFLKIKGWAFFGRLRLRDAMLEGTRKVTAATYIQFKHQVYLNISSYHHRP